MAGFNTIEGQKSETDRIMEGKESENQLAVVQALRSRLIEVTGRCVLLEIEKDKSNERFRQIGVLMQELDAELAHRNSVIGSLQAAICQLVGYGQQHAASMLQPDSSYQSLPSIPTPVYSPFLPQPSVGFSRVIPLPHGTESALNASSTSLGQVVQCNPVQNQAELCVTPIDSGTASCHTVPALSAVDLKLNCVSLPVAQTGCVNKSGLTQPDVVSPQIASNAVADSTVQQPPQAAQPETSACCTKPENPRARKCRRNAEDAPPNVASRALSSAPTRTVRQRSRTRRVRKNSWIWLNSDVQKICDSTFSANE